MLAHNMTFSKTLSGLVIIYQSGVSTSTLLLQAWVLTKEVWSPLVDRTLRDGEGEGGRSSPQTSFNRSK